MPWMKYTIYWWGGKVVSRLINLCWCLHLGGKVWWQQGESRRIFAITSCCEHDYFIYGLSGLMVSGNAEQQDPIASPGALEIGIGGYSPAIQSKRIIGRKPNRIQSPKLHVIHSAKLSHQQWTLPLYPQGPPRLSQEHFNSLYLACCWAHYPLIHTQAERLSSSKRIWESSKAFTGAMQLRPEKLSHILDPILLRKLGRRIRGWTGQKFNVEIRETKQTYHKRTSSKCTRLRL